MAENDSDALTGLIAQIKPDTPPVVRLILLSRLRELPEQDLELVAQSLEHLELNYPDLLDDLVPVSYRDFLLALSRWAGPSGDFMSHRRGAIGDAPSAVMVEELLGLGPREPIDPISLLPPETVEMADQLARYLVLHRAEQAPTVRAERSDVRRWGPPKIVDVPEASGVPTDEHLAPVDALDVDQLAAVLDDDLATVHRLYDEHVVYGFLAPSRGLVFPTWQFVVEEDAGGARPLPHVTDVVQVLPRGWSPLQVRGFFFYCTVQASPEGDAEIVFDYLAAGNPVEPALEAARAQSWTA